MNFSPNPVPLSALSLGQDHVYEELLILSIEGGLYQPFVKVSGAYHAVRDAHQKIIVTRSAAAARKPFETLAFDRVNLLHRSCYDEMIGQPPGADNTAVLPQANPAIDSSVG